MSGDRRSSTRVRFIAWVCLCSAIALRPGVAGSVDEPAGYRLGNYRAEVPATLKGARVIGTEEAKQLWNARSALFIDVLPRPPKPEALPEGTVWRNTRRDNIPGSVWLPNVGFGRLHEKIDRYFRNSLHRLSEGDKGRPLLFYCLDRCWMSWNAAKRALEYGYRNVLWYPAGTDGWTDSGFPVEESTPLPFAD